MKTSESGVDLIKRFEGLELEAYQDIAGVWTIGYGHTETVKPGQRITEREAEALLRRDLKPREDAVKRLTSVPLNQNEFDALISFVYNVGVDAYRRSTARKRLNAGNRIGAADALTWWNKATVGGVLREVTGLTRRRAAERALFLTPTNPPIVNDVRQIDNNSRATPFEDPPRRESLAGSRTVQGATVAGGAGAAASSMGRNTAEDLEQMEAQTDDSGAADPPPANDNLTPAEGDPDPSAEEDAQTPPVEDDETTQETIEEPAEPAPQIDSSAVESQIQFALLILIVLAVLYIIYARIDDWWHYRR